MTIPLEEIAANTNEFGWKILKLLNQDNSTFLEMKKELGLSQEKCYKEISRLEGALLIVSRRDPKDQRSNLFSLSEYGKALLKLHM